MNEAGVAPPGTMPMKQPTAELRSDVSQYRGSSRQVSITAFVGVVFRPLAGALFLGRRTSRQRERPCWACGSRNSSYALGFHG